MRTAEEVLEAVEVFDEFVNIGISSGLDDVDPIQIVRSYNVIRDYINSTVDINKEE